MIEERVILKSIRGFFEFVFGGFNVAISNATYYESDNYRKDKLDVNKFIGSHACNLKVVGHIRCILYLIRLT